MSDDRKMPRAGQSIEVASDPFGRVRGEWLAATVTAVSADGAIITATAEGAGLEGEALPASIAVESPMWRHPA